MLEWDLRKNKSSTKAVTGNGVQFATVETPQGPLHISHHRSSQRTRATKAPGTDEELLQSVLNCISVFSGPRSLAGPLYRAQEALFKLLTKYVNAVFESQDEVHRQNLDISRHAEWQNILSRCQVISKLNRNQKTWLDRPQKRPGGPTPPRRSVAYTDIQRVFKHDILDSLERPAAMSGPYVLPEILAACITLVALAPQLGSIAFSYLRYFIERLHQLLHSSQDDHSIGLMNLLTILSRVPDAFILDMLRIACFCTHKALEHTLRNYHPIVLHARTIYFRFFGASEIEKGNLIASYESALKKVKDLYDPDHTNPSDERILWVLVNYATAACYIKDDRTTAKTLSEHLWSLTQPTGARWTSWTLTSHSMVEAVRIITLCDFVHNIRQAQPENKNHRRMLHKRARGKKSKKNKARVRRRLREQNPIKERPTQERRDQTLANLQRAIDQLPELSWDSKIAEADLRETLIRLSRYRQPQRATQSYKTERWRTAYAKQGVDDRIGIELQSAARIWREIVDYYKFFNPIE